MPTNKEIFFKAIFLEPPRICGKRLLSFSLAHEYFLSYSKNPYIVGGQVTKDDLLTAVLACTMTHKQIKKHLYKPSRIRTWLWFLGWRFRDLQKAHGEFQTYLQDHFDVPDHFENEPNEDEEPPVEADKRTCYGGPWQYHMVHILCREYGMTIDDAWNMPVTTARCYYDVWSESTGFDNSIVPVTAGAPLLGVPA